MMEASDAGADERDNANFPFQPLHYLYLTAPLYERFQLQEKHRQWMKFLWKETLAFDGPCLECGKESHFRSDVNPYQPPPKDHLKPGFRDASEPDWLAALAFVRAFRCTRYHAHTMRFWFQVDHNSTGVYLQKIGQFPSLADLSMPELRAYKKVLGDDRLREMTRAIGLAAHGVGIGAFVYLRRIFESLLGDHRKIFEASGGTLVGYETMRVEEKIDALKTTLPQLLLSNRKVYSVLSKGIHELDEETCLTHFPVLRQAIILILRQEAEKRSREEAEKNLTAEVGKIAGSLKDV
jgi:hypothetical protein